MSKRRKPIRQHPAKMTLAKTERVGPPRHPADEPQKTTLMYGRVRDAVWLYQKRVLDVPGDERRAWGTMIYACAGNDPKPESKGCGWEHRVWMLLGVEGPPPLREAGNIIPAPFFCGGCPECGGRLHHDRWNEDEEWDAPGKPLPADVAFFSVPDVSSAIKSARSGYQGADYTDPTGRTTTAPITSTGPHDSDPRKEPSDG